MEIANACNQWQRRSTQEDLEDHIRKLRLRSNIESEIEFNEEIEEELDLAFKMAKSITHEYKYVSCKTLIAHMVCFIPFMTLGGWLLSHLEGPGEEARALQRKADSRSLHDALDFAVADGCLNGTALDLVDKRCEIDLVPFNYKDMDWYRGGGFYMIAQVVTTVGYGTYAPVTKAGKAIICLYAVFGIGWFGYFLILLSEKQHNVMREFVILKLDDNPSLPAMIRNLSTRSKTFALLTFSVLGYLAGLGIAAVAYHAYQGDCLDRTADCNHKIAFLDAVYFSLISFSNVVLGDIAPPFWNSHRADWQLLLLWFGWSITLLIGLSLLSFVIAEVDILVRERALVATMTTVLKAWHSVEHSVANTRFAHYLEKHIASHNSPHPSLRDLHKLLGRGLSKLSKGSHHALKTDHHDSHAPVGLGNREDSNSLEAARSTDAAVRSRQVSWADRQSSRGGGGSPMEETVLCERFDGDNDLSAPDLQIHTRQRQEVVLHQRAQRAEGDADQLVRCDTITTDPADMQRYEGCGSFGIGRFEQKGEKVNQEQQGQQQDFQDCLHHVVTLLENTNVDRWRGNSKKALEFCKEEASRYSQAPAPRHDADQFMMKLLHLLLE